MDKGPIGNIEFKVDSVGPITSKPIFVVSIKATVKLSLEIFPIASVTFGILEHGSSGIDIRREHILTRERTYSNQICVKLWIQTAFTVFRG